MIFHEGTEKGGVGTFRFHGVEPIDKVTYTATRGLEGLGDPIVPENVNTVA